MLLLETDDTRQSYGQILTRMEAFFESLNDENKLPKKKIEGKTHMYVLGIDSGSTSTNAVIMDQDRKIAAFSVVRTGAKSSVSADKALEDVENKNTGEVPLHLRNAPVEQMKNFGYHNGYKYPHDYPNHYVEQQYLPDELVGRKYYNPKTTSKYEMNLKNIYDRINKV